MKEDHKMMCEHLKNWTAQQVFEHIAKHLITHR